MKTKKTKEVKKTKKEINLKDLENVTGGAKNIVKFKAGSDLADAVQ